MEPVEPITRRRLWQPPAPIKEARSDDRRIAFLELFFDLVFVVLVAQLAHHLAQDPSWSSFGWFVFLFFIVWSSWLNGSFYHDAHGTNDLSIRLITFAQMVALAVMGAFIGSVPGTGDTGFALAYAANSLVLAVIWLRTGVHDPEHRSGAYPYAVAFVIGAALFVASVWTSAPATYWLWAVAVAVQAAAAIPAVRILRREFGAVLATRSLLERFGLIVIIVLGEVVAGAVNGIANHEPKSPAVVAIGVLGVLLAVEMWWLYFDLVADRMHRRSGGLWWMYLHVPLIIGIAGAGAAVLASVEQVGEPASTPVRWLLVGTVALTLVCICALVRTVDVGSELEQASRRCQLALMLAAGAVLLVGLTSATSALTLGGVLAILVLPIVLSVEVWRAD